MVTVKEKNKIEVGDLVRTGSWDGVARTAVVLELVVAARDGFVDIQFEPNVAVVVDCEGIRRRRALVLLQLVAKGRD